MARRIVYVYGPANTVAGGIKAAFQHVELLTDAGFDAAIATPDAAAPTWFASRAPRILHSEISHADLLVLPENFRPYLEAFAPAANRKFVFCQNPWYVHEGLGPRLSYADYGVEHILCTSWSVVQFCRLRFPGMALAYTPPMVDPSVFHPRAKKRQLAVTPRKRPVEFGTVHDLFRHRYPQYDDFRWVVLQGASESQVAEVLGESEIFLSMARMEAHSLTTMEAMASGALVAGFCGVAGGDDTASPRNGFWAEEEDVPGCVEQLARAMAMVVSGGGALQEMLAQASATAAGYSREESGARLAQFWRAKLDGLG